jgi:hypothetical protein
MKPSSPSSLGLLSIAALLCFATSCAAQAQTAAAIDLRSKCVIDGIPAVPALTATWSGACIEGRAAGFGEIYGFSAGRIRYILRGHFNVGRLDQQEAMRDCTNSNCADDVARSILQLHEQHAQSNPISTASSTTTASAPVATSTPAPAASDAKPEANPAAVVTSPLSAPVAAPALPTAVPQSSAPVAANTAVPVREIRAPNATFRGRFATNPANGVISGEGRVDYDGGASYEGRIVNGRKVGRGTYVWPDGLSYTGDWVDDQQTGRGLLKFKNGDSYEGDVVNGVFQGVGTYKQASGDSYTGDWVRGKREGRGVSERTNGQRYEGDWKADRREGVGTENFPDGSRYEGQWRGDQATGKGDIVFASGDAYTGEVVNGIAQGEGVYRWGSGDRFDGEFANGKPVDARGKMSFFFDVAASSIKVEEGAKNEAPALPPTAASGNSNAASVSTVNVANNANTPVAPPTREALCIRAFNSASNQVALKRFLDTYSDDECGRANIAKQKLAALVERERANTKAAEDRSALAKMFIGARVAYLQDFPYCVVGTGSNCQRVTYSFNVRAQIRDLDVQKRTAQVQITGVDSLGQQGNGQNPLFAQGRVGATDAFRARMLGTTQTRSLDELGVAFNGL